MNLPGFTADNSLWNTNGRQYIDTSPALLTSGGAVSQIIPSLQYLPPGLGGYRSNKGLLEEKRNHRVQLKVLSTV